MTDYIFTKPSNCVDCYKCVRNCTVKAIRIKEGHAQVIPERCILCGRCLEICPQKAKQVTNALPKIQAMLIRGEKVVVSLAPSYIVTYPDATPEQIKQAFLLLGFTDVEETAIGAAVIAKEYKRLHQESSFFISSDCPSLVNLIEIYHPEQISALAPLVSPMIAHGRMIKAAWKQQYQEEVKVVFVGPCAAKMDEMDKLPGAIDAVLTFQQVSQWLQNREINPVELKVAEQEQQYTAEAARLYPMEGGMLLSAGESNITAKCETINGFEACEQFLKTLPANKGSLSMVEMNICQNACVNGPEMCSPLSMLERRQRLFSYATDGKHLPTILNYDGVKVELTRHFKNNEYTAPNPSQEDLEALLHKIGKYSPADELNCGACGYNSCREKAVAVYQGMAELEMCIPYMKRKAESRANKIVERDPNGILIVDDHGLIKQFNKAFLHLLSLQPEEKISNSNANVILGMELPVPEGIETSTTLIQHPTSLKVFSLIAYRLDDEDLTVYIFIDVTNRVRNRDKLNEWKHETIERAEEVIHKQMRVAQEIASLLGETTADTKVSLLKLIKVMKEEDDIHDEYC